jgi:hypothetical protein
LKPDPHKHVQQGESKRHGRLRGRQCDERSKLRSTEDVESVERLVEPSLLGWDSMAFVEPSLLGCVAAAAVAVDERSKLRSTEDVESIEFL